MPHPAIIFFGLIGVVIVLSVIFGIAGTSVAYDGYDEATSSMIPMHAQVRSLPDGDGIRFMVTSPVMNFRGFTGVGVILVAMIGVGLAGALAKWAILAPIFVPLFMRLGGEPNLVLAAYRVGTAR